MCKVEDAESDKALSGTCRQGRRDQRGNAIFQAPARSEARSWCIVTAVWRGRLVR
jgi:hypothetical protein